MGVITMLEDDVEVEIGAFQRPIDHLYVGRVEERIGPPGDERLYGIRLAFQYRLEDQGLVADKIVGTHGKRGPVGFLKWGLMAS